ncbi:hypothetical protein CUZ56_01365 [Saezia sanguinis]|uniref:Integrating conjugative element membrane protein n=1 Tax=Saezia sanguinis TaxID=1965230 RepID=A0A433SFC1_9BURK|nr:TIGR03747 family integrating conjugative element membrane protein [Saezia sanguinis]RUS67420.1 hypothetical protein CUZ56_01365 [Saezia sanguinis]
MSSNTATTVKHQQAAPKNLFWSIATLPLTLFGVLCGSLLLSILVEIVGMHLFWKDQGWHHAQNMFYFELEMFSENFSQSIMLSDPVAVTRSLLSMMHEWLFIRTGLFDEVRTIVIPTDADSLRKLQFREYIGMAYGYIETYALAAAFTVLTFGVRVMVLFFSLPLAVMVIFVGLVDGLVQRDIRRFTSEHESGFIYHRAKAFLIPLVILPWMVYLALPVSVYPQLILLPGAMLLGTAINITASRFKKYL